MTIDEQTPRNSSDMMRDRIEASLPADDLRFTAMRDILAQARRAGKGSPAARMLGEWALLGFLLTTGQLSLGSESGGAEVAQARADLAKVEAARSHVADALKDISWG